MEDTEDRDVDPGESSKDSRVELAILRAMLREQRQATLRAMQTAVQLRNKVSLAEAEVESRQAGVVDSARHAPGWRNVWGAIIAVAAVIACMAMFLENYGAPDAPETGAPAPVLVADRLSGAGSPVAFATALSELDQALAAFPGRIPEDVLREAAAKDRACLLHWNDGHPSFLLEPQTTRGSSLSLALAQCADAVRLLRPG